MTRLETQQQTLYSWAFDVKTSLGNYNSPSPKL